jgi:hypothetical protein
MICAKCHKNKSVHMFSPCMAKFNTSSRVHCRKCVSEMNGNEFGQVGKGRAALKTKSVVLKREEEKADSLAKIKHEAEKKRIAELLENRRKRLAGE